MADMSFSYPGNSRVFYPDRPVKRIYTESGAAIRSYAEVVKRAEAQVAKESQLMIGTSPLEIRAALSIGCPRVHCTDEISRKCALDMPDGDGARAVGSAQKI